MLSFPFSVRPILAPVNERGAAALRAARSRGVTLIEVLVVLALVTMLFAGIASGTGRLSGARMRAAASLVMNSVRVAITHANSRGRPVRLVFDLDEQRLILEETRGRMLRVKDSDEGAKAGAAAATELEREASEMATRFGQGPQIPKPRFSPVASYGRDEQGLGRSLGQGIRYMQVQTEHDPEPIVEGRAYLYFWPGGGTEQAAIQVGRAGDFDGLTVLVTALTGRSYIERGRIDMEDSLRDTYFEERDDD